MEKLPLRIAITYGIIGGLWVIFSDALLSVIVDDPSHQLKIQTIKSWVFVLVTAWLLYILVKRGFAKMHQSKVALEDSEARMRAILDTAVDGIITINEHGTVESFNNAAEKLFDYSADEMIGRNISILMPSADADRHDGYLQNYVKSRQKKIIGIGREVIARRKDGSTFPVHLSVSEFLIGSNRRFTGIVRDITEQKTLQKQILQTERLAIIGKMAAKVAHEVRNPLSSISLNAELLEDEIQGYDCANTEEARALLESMIREIDRVTSLTDEYLQFSRLPESQLVKGNLGELIGEVTEAMRNEFDQKNIELEFEVADNSMDMRFDRAQFRRVLLNIIRNAIEAMPKGGRLKIWLERNEHNGMVHIQDTGVGIPKSMVDAIFDPFFTTKDFGTGLGLAISQQIIEEHGGRIMCSSQAGKGATFSIILPLTNSQ